MLNVEFGRTVSAIGNLSDRSDGSDGSAFEVGMG